MVPYRYAMMWWRSGRDTEPMDNADLRDAVERFAENPDRRSTLNFWWHLPAKSSLRSLPGRMLALAAE